MNSSSDATTRKEARLARFAALMKERQELPDVQSVLNTITDINAMNEKMKSEQRLLRDYHEARIKHAIEESARGVMVLEGDMALLDTTQDDVASDVPSDVPSNVPPNVASDVASDVASVDDDEIESDDVDSPLVTRNYSLPVWSRCSTGSSSMEIPSAPLYL
eukprot:TRINITY_DN8031_c0_g2_i1.p1 TRINITY_DN8031_c0_g2~~TRINITY_DN8031_c0_g2_i1.p1  ORF type:complete len:162 (-),score=13.06 TRINITY_DN8031_c0_g2_i1:427-912(-)